MAFDPISAGFEFAGKLLDRLIADPQQRADATMKLAEMRQTGELAVLAAETDLAKGQLAVNAEEAKSESLFVAGWRPAIGWVCAAAFAYHFVLQPLMAFVLAQNGREVELPDFDMETLSTVLMGMLGLGGLRTIERVTKIRNQ